MTAKQALKRSIAKWEKIVARAGKSNGRVNCPLCKLFYDNDCDGCPVKRRTHQRCCDKTPYAKWEQHHDCEHRDSETYWSWWQGWLRMRQGCKACATIAHAELEFLQNLLAEMDAEGK